MKIDATTLSSFQYQPGVHMTPLLTDDLPAPANAAGFGFYRGILEPGARIADEAHAQTETVYVLAGRAAATVDGVDYRLSAGQVLHVAAGLRHEIVNASEDDDLDILIVGCPDFGE